MFLWINIVINASKKEIESIHCQASLVFEIALDVADLLEVISDSSLARKKSPDSGIQRRPMVARRPGKSAKRKGIRHPQSIICSSPKNHSKEKVMS